MGNLGSLRPLIGVPCYAAARADSQRPLYGNNQSYITAVAAAGGVPVMIPPLADAESLRAVCARLDGLLLTGGGDLDPALYGQEAIPACQAPEPERDALEIELARWAVEAGVPVFGICRGMQVLNVACGGSLHQDVEVAGASKHDSSDQPRGYRAHTIAIAPDSRLAAILGATEQSVNSLHHQSVDRPGHGVRLVAQAPDGVAEAMELPAHPFALAVQYHPEEMVATDEPSRRLFAAFVAACAERG